MNRRDLLKSISILGVPKPIADVNVCHDQLNLYTMIVMLKKAIRFEMPTPQWTAWAALTTYADDAGAENASGMMNAMPIAVNENVPKNEIWLVGHDGTLVGKITRKCSSWY